METSRAEIELVDVGKSFGNRRVLKGVTFRLQPRQVIGITGANGSGKTCLLDIMSGYLSQDHGRLLYRGRWFRRPSPLQLARMGYARTFQSGEAMTSLSLLDLEQIARDREPSNEIDTTPSATGDGSRLTSLQWAEALRITRLFNCSLASLSPGQRKMAQAYLVSIGRSKCILMDEPLAGVDAEGCLRLGNLAVALREEGRSVCVVEHNREWLERYAERVFVLADGRLSEL